MLYSPSSAQHIGSRREQQDALTLYTFPDSTILAVLADGMGGMAHGEKASRVAIDAFLSAYRQKSADESIPEALDRAIRSTNDAVFQLALVLGSAEDMGTTLVAVVLDADHLVAGALGEPREVLLCRRVVGVDLQHFADGDGVVPGEGVGVAAAIGLVTKRLDSGSAWPISNNPRGRYYNARPGSKAIANSSYPLWQVVRASTAAPSYFEPEKIEILHGGAGQEPAAGEFVDGGMSPFNNPSLQALMYATLDGYHVGWPTGADKLLVVSVGTGARDPSVAHSMLAAKHALQSMLSLMDDCAALMETLLQWMSSSPTAKIIDRELGDLRHDLVAPAPLISYLRYNVALDKDSLTQLGMTLAADKIEGLSAMDVPENMTTLREVGAKAAEQQVSGADFPSNFDLR